jgi:hypothetical protein
LIIIPPSIAPFEPEANIINWSAISNEEALTIAPFTIKSPPIVVLPVTVKVDPIVTLSGKAKVIERFEPNAAAVPLVTVISLAVPNTSKVTLP